MAACGGSGLGDFETIDVEVGSERLTVAVAETPEQRRQGLRGVESLPEGIDGMLFVWAEPTFPSFTMRDTVIPLDLWWFDESGLLLGSVEMRPCLEVSCPGYGAPGPVMWAVETPAGEYQFRPGAVLSTVEKG